ncbi:hypothetical protein [Pseudomonas sp. NPDC089534]|uniref:hypothetical protein n=1 Tax=Pseudomonas sp. NPDC089534 TaxID=3364468 RepID=UPI003807BB07
MGIDLQPQDGGGQYDLVKLVPDGNGSVSAATGGVVHGPARAERRMFNELSASPMMATGG